MRKLNWAAILAIVVLIFMGFFVALSLYYGVGAGAYTPPERELQDVSLEVAAIAPRNPVEDNPATNQGVVVVDFAHNNALFVEELNTLFSKIVSRGFSYELVTSDGDEDNGQTLLDRLEYAKALILPAPRADFSAEEIAGIERFVEKGGRIFIIGDPTRTISVDALNSIAGSFDIIYANDYLYSLNQESNDNNYRNVIYSNFNQSPITEGLSEENKVIFYSGGSVTAPGHEIIMGDEHTHSSTSEGGRTVAAAALTTNDQVLALSDLTFLGEPYSVSESNGVLINNIADFLTGGTRSFELRDFPYFFNDDINVVFKNTLVFNSQFDDSVALKQMLENLDRSVTFTDEIGQENDAIFIGRFDNTENVQAYLDAGQIEILEPQPDPQDGEVEEAVQNVVPVAQTSDGSNGEQGPGSEEEPEEEPAPPKVGDSEIDTDADQEFVEGRIRIANVGELERGGSTLFYRHQEGDRNILIILSDNPDTNSDAIELLMNGEIDDCLVSPNIAVCQTDTPDGRLAPSLRSIRIDKILVVSDDDGRPRENAQTSMMEYVSALSDTYRVDTWVTSDEGSPDLEELQEYDAIVWTTGNYWDDSIEQVDTDMLVDYIEAGGNLILSGASIAFDWDHTDFLENVVHADYLNFAEQQDIELVIEEHPIARGFAQGDVLTFTATASEEPVEPDVVNHTPDARVIFARGPGSQETGAASIIAYEDDRSKIAYLAFPVYLLTPEPRVTILQNTVDWFTRKPLDLPDESDYTPYESDDSGRDDAAEEPTDTEGEEGAEGEETEDTTDEEENGDGETDDTGGDDSGESQ